MESTRETAHRDTPLPPAHRDVARPKDTRSGVADPPAPTQAEANGFKSHSPAVETAALAAPADPDPPSPTQDEADGFKLDAHGVGEDETAPENVDVPSVQPMTAGPGDTLTCTMGNWNGEPTHYSGQWMRDGTEQCGSGPSYVVTESDVGHSISCVVTATNAIGGTAAPPSNAVAIAASRAARSDPSTSRK
jgi:hypothetical protein